MASLTIFLILSLVFPFIFSEFRKFAFNWWYWLAMSILICSFAFLLFVIVCFQVWFTESLVYFRGFSKFVFLRHLMFFMVFLSFFRFVFGCLCIWRTTCLFYGIFVFLMTTLECRAVLLITFCASIFMSTTDLDIFRILDIFVRCLSLPQSDHALGIFEHFAIYRCCSFSFGFLLTGFS